MNIELRNVKHAAFDSQETDCFEATIYIDGKRAGTVRNEGNGVPNMYDPWAIEKPIEEYAKTLPPYPLDMGDGRIEHVEQSADGVIGDLLGKFLAAKDMKRKLKSRILFTKADGKLYVTSTLTPAQMAACISGKMPVRDAVTILNRLPEAEALALYLKAGA